MITPNIEADRPGFFGLERSRPALSAIPETVRSRVTVPALPSALRERALDTASALISDPARHRRILPNKLRADAQSFEDLLLQRTSLGPTVVDRETIAEIGAREYLERQLHPEEIDDGGLEDTLVAAFPTLNLSAWDILINYKETPEVPVYELWLATLYRSLFSPRQLYERMVIFWTDHFNVSLLSDLGIYLKPGDDRDVIRRHALGTFPELLSASAHSGAMLSYLTNDTNVKDHPNENYARELMELHTLGVDGGYTEDDVKEVARALTGWRFFPYQAGPQFGDFFFNASQHDNELKTVLGNDLPAGGGQADGERVLEILVSHPSTASFVSRKMLAYLWGYQPSARAVERVASVYRKTGGDIRSMLREILSWSSLATATQKLKRPYHLIVSAVRALFASVEEPFFLLEAANRAGHLPFTWAPPNGFPDSDGYWSGYVLPRWNFSQIVLAPQSGVAVDLPFLNPQMPPEEIRYVLDVLLLGGTMSVATSVAVADYLTAAPQNQKTLAEAIGLVLGSPEFQHY
ncbi:MAG: DUF1800 domain-containing protein [Acidobacteriota bacterium]